MSAFHESEIQIDDSEIDYDRLYRDCIAYNARLTPENQRETIMDMNSVQQLDFDLRDYGMDSALEQTKIMMEDLSILNVTSWQLWIAVSDVDYCDGLIYENDGPRTFELTKRYFAFGNFSKYIEISGFLLANIFFADNVFLYSEFISSFFNFSL